MGLFSAIFPGVRDDSGHFAAARNVCTVGIGGAAAAVLGKAAGTTAIAVNPLGGFLYCATAALVHITVGAFIREVIVKGFAPNVNDALGNKIQSKPIQEATSSVLRAADVISTAATIALTTLAISLLAPHYALAGLTGLLTCVASLALNALFDSSMVKIGVVK